MTMNLNSVALHRSKLPNVPKVAQIVIAGLASGEATLGQIAQWVHADPVLCMRLLRLANSAYFQVSRTIESVDDALQLIGLSTVRHLALGSGLLVTFQDVPGVDLPQFWRHSLYTASVASWLAERCGEQGDLAFTLGLIHGVGQLQLHVAAAQAMPALDAECSIFDRARPAAERRVLGFDFGQVSGALARHWHFPPAMAQTLESVPDPGAASPFQPLAALVHLGAWRASEEMLAATPREATYPHDVASALQLAPGWALTDCSPPPPPLESGAPTARQLPALPEWSKLTRGLEVLLT